MKRELEEITFDDGLVLRLEGLESEVTRKGIREVHVVHVDTIFRLISRGQTEAHIRLSLLCQRTMLMKSENNSKVLWCGSKYIRR